ncbi:VCBS domain-containing protein [Marinobacter sp. 2_MG-2023]|uniref:VCBS domain-containing protein n=1 Tax=Marinobacter sp. 2_MG-2023 TaxID=3062679 RepID=UPI0026E40A2D|nr:VCBS domain-containing protein [Marinobacter sp. 2_MG-2023]MDO6440946.1 VCBS domain-containing protein [Marinobacter sp. 2_MG-2023]
MIRRFVQWAARGDRPAENSGGSKLFFEPMEPKILLSADALSGLLPASPSSDEHSAPLTMQDSVELFEDLAGDEQALAAAPNDPPSLDELGASLLSPGELSDRLEIVFIDANAPDYQQLLQGIGDWPGVETRVFVLEADADGTAQISSILAEYQDVDAIHLLSHGDDTGFQLGRDWIGASSLDNYTNDFSNWDQSLSQGADILIYGCNLASDPAGERLLNDLARLTGADIAASDDLTGHASLGGDWDLEFASGDIDTSVIADAELQDVWVGALATETLNPSQDTYVDDNSDETNYGSSQFLIVDKSGGGVGDQRTLVQFDLSTIPAGSTITSATLYLTAVDITGSLTVSAYQVTEAWVGNTVTYDTQPGHENGASSGFNAWAGQIVDGQPVDHDWDITSLVQAWVDGTASNYGVLLGSEESGDEQVQYYSSESGNSPRLEVIYDDSLTATDNAGEVTEEGPASASGNVITDDDGDGVDSDPEDSINDLEVSAVGGNAGDVGETVAGSYGSLTIGSDGIYTYNLDNTSAAVQALGVGQTLTDTFSYTLSDLDGDTDTATLTITINGTNDDPVATANTNLLAAGGTSVSGNMLTDNNGAGVDSDIDGDTLNVSAIDATGADQYGTLSFNADGSYTYTLNTGDSIVLSLLQALGLGQTLTETYEYTVSDGQGGIDTASLTITINGTNDAPVAEADAVGTGENVILNENVPAASDVNGTIVSYALGTTVAEGSLSFNSDGSYSFDPGPDFDDLAVGATRDVTFTYTAMDNDGAVSAEETITITVTGANDAPVVVAGAVGTGENAILNESVPAASDVDGTIASYALGTTVTEGSLSFNSDGSYSFDPGPDFDDLAVGATRDVTFTYTAMDNDGAVSAEETITITVTGANDAPVATANSNQITEDAVSVSGNMLTDDDGAGVDSDIDGDTLSVSAIDATGADQYGTLTLNDADGSYTYAIDNSNPAVQALSVGQSLTEVYTYTVIDGQGGTDTATLTITIDGSNDQPVSGTAQPDQTSTDGETITPLDVSGNFSDIDSSDTLTFSASNLPAGLSIDTNTGVISGTIDGSASQSGPFTVTITADDGSGTGSATRTDTFLWTVTNPAPTATDNTDTVTEDGPSSASGNVITDDDGAGVDSDPDDPVSQLVVSEVDGSAGDVGTAVAGSYGTVTIDPDGGYTYNLDNTSVAVQALAAGETLTDTFSYTMSDQDSNTDTASLTITITGSNDAPVIIGGPDSVALNETDSGLASNGDFTVSDLDTGDSVTASVIDLVVGGTSDRTDPAAPSDADLKAMLTVSPTTIVDSAGNSATLGWSFDSASEAFDYLAAGETLELTYTLRAEDSQGATANETVTITITGTNDAPTVSGLQESTSYSGGSGMVPLNDIVISDVDGAETVTATLTLLNPDVGQLSDNNGAVYNQTTGVWSITGTVADVNTALANLTFIPRPDNDLDSTVAINIDDGNEDGSGPLLGTLKVFVDVPPEVSDDLIGDINDSPGEDAGAPVSESQEEIQEETPEESPEEQSAESSEGTVVTGGGSFGPLEASRDETSEFVSPFDELDQTQGAFEVSMANVASNNEQSAASVSESEKVVQFLRSQITQLNEPFELLDRDNFIRQLDDMRQELVEEQSQVEKLIGASVSVSAGLSVGYVIWLARSGIIMSSVLSSLPAWRLIDPLPVLATLSAPAAEEDRESLESMVTEANQSKSSGSDQNEPG